MSHQISETCWISYADQAPADLINTNSTKCTLSLDFLIPYLDTGITSLEIFGFLTKKSDPIIVEFEESPFLIQNPLPLRGLSFKLVSFSWAQLTVFMQHIYLSPLPTARTHNDTIISLAFPSLVAAEFNTSLYLNSWLPFDTKIEDAHILNEYDSHAGLKPLIGMEKIDFFTLNLFLPDHPVSFKIPAVLQNYLWPELKYLEIDVTDFNITDILNLRDTAPKLEYLSLNFIVDLVPETVWTIDWNMLPWTTGFSYLSKNYYVVLLDLANKVTMDVVRHIAFTFSYIVRPKYCTRRRNLFIDFSNNQLTSLENIHFYCNAHYNIHLNFSHNSLKYVNLSQRFYYLSIFDPGPLCF